MTKKEFLDRLEHKLRVLSKEEIQDILNEYSGYLDNKIQEGKSEEDAVKDFGNLNDLASDILSAYKLNDNYTKDKVGGIIDNLVDVIMHAADSMTTFFKEKAPQMSVEDIVRLIIYVIIGLVLIAILKIPFSIIEELLKGIVSWILPWFLAGPLRFIISIAINLIYFCIAIMLVANFIRTATDEKDFTLKEFLRKPMVINVDVRESFQSMFKKEPIQRNKVEQEEKQECTAQENRQTHASVVKQGVTSDAPKDEADDTKLTEEGPQLFQYRQPKESADYLDDPEYLTELEEIEDEARAEWKQAQRNNKRNGNPISSLFLLLLQIITCLVLCPFFFAMAGCSLAFGVGIFLLFSGAKIWGIVLVLAGLIGVISGFTSFLWKAVRPGSKRKKGRLISFLVSIVIIGAGLMLSIVEFSQYETKTFSQFLSNPSSTVEKVEYLSLTSFETINFNYLKTPITTEVSPVAEDNTLELVFTLNEAYHVGLYYYDSNEISYKINDYPQSSQNLKIVKTILASLQDQVYLVPSESQDLAYSVKIRASQKTLDQVKIDGNIVTLQK